MRFAVVTASVVLLPLAAACTKSPTSPSPDGGGSTVFEGQTVSATDGSPSPNLTVRIGERTATSDGSGFFQIDLGATGTYRAAVRGNGVVERETRVTGPGATPTRLSMIPSTFDLTAFDEMFRSLNARLERWTTRPSLVVLASVMDYRGSGQSYEATGEQLTDDEVTQMVAHLTEGLAALTGNTYPSFAAVDVERPTAGTRVIPIRDGRIVVGRYNGIVTFARTIGYGQWVETSEGTIVSGAMFLDRDFDKNDSRRRLLRIHELGHALGYQHVESRTSIMNPAIGPELNDFDRAGAMIAFQRPVGNRAPDVDPTSTSVSVSTGDRRLSAPTVCR
jgi:Matrixin